MTRNLPMKVVASDIGVDESTYCLWESGKRFPNAENLDAIADYTNRPICQFFRMGNQCGICGDRSVIEQTIASTAASSG